jgi:multisubunit Na+/H+ antiporter MnhB subunit
MRYRMVAIVGGIILILSGVYTEQLRETWWRNSFGQIIYPESLIAAGAMLCVLTIIPNALAKRIFRSAKTASRLPKRISARHGVKSVSPGKDKA